MYTKEVNEHSPLRILENARVFFGGAGRMVLMRSLQ